MFGVPDGRAQELGNLTLHQKRTQTEVMFMMLSESSENIWDGDMRERLKSIMPEKLKKQCDEQPSFFLEEAQVPITSGTPTKISAEDIVLVSSEISQRYFIPFGLRLGQSYTTLERFQREIPQAEARLHKVMDSWKRNLPDPCDERSTLALVLSACRLNKLARKIGGEIIKVKVSHSNQTLNQKAESFPNHRLSLNNNQDHCNEVESASSEEERRKSIIERVQALGTEWTSCEIFDVTVEPIVFHFRAHSDTEKNALLESIDNGRLAEKLGKVLIPADEENKFADNVVFCLEAENECVATDGSENPSHTESRDAFRSGKSRGSVEQATQENVLKGDHRGKRGPLVLWALIIAVIAIIAIIAFIAFIAFMAPKWGALTDTMPMMHRKMDPIEKSRPKYRDGQRADILEESISENLTAAKLQSMLRRYYEEVMCKIRIIPSDPTEIVNMNTLFTTVSLYKRDKGGAPDRRRSNVILPGSLNDVFQTYVDGFLPKRIVMYGKAGRGKTTAVAKLAYDWAVSLEGSPLKDVPFLFALKLRRMTASTSIGEAVVRQLLPIEYANTAKAIDQFILNNGANVILIFDGYDEFSGNIASVEDVSSTMHTIRYETCRECRVLVTSRSFRKYHFRRLRKENPNFAAVYAEMELEGFSYKNAMEFIDNFYQDNATRGRNLKTYLEQEEVVSDLIATPLFCAMVCIMWNDGRLNGSYTRTTFFNEMIIFLESHTKAKTQGMDDNDIRWNEVITLPETLYHMGMVAVQRLVNERKEDALIFQDEDFRDVQLFKDYSLKLGLLGARNESARQEQEYEFFHRLAQEMAAATYLSKSSVYLEEILKCENVHESAGSRDACMERIFELEEVLLFLSGLSDTACSSIVDLIVRNTNESFAPTHHSLLLSIIGEADRCGGDSYKFESLLSYWQQSGILALHDITSVHSRGLEKLPQSVTEIITETHIRGEMPSLTARATWAHLKKFTNLKTVRMRQATFKGEIGTQISSASNLIVNDCKLGLGFQKLLVSLPNLHNISVNLAWDSNNDSIDKDLLGLVLGLSGNPEVRSFSYKSSTAEVSRETMELFEDVLFRGTPRLQKLTLQRMNITDSQLVRFVHAVRRKRTVTNVKISAIQNSVGYETDAYLEKHNESHGPIRLEVQLTQDNKNSFQNIKGPKRVYHLNYYKNDESDPWRSFLAIAIPLCAICGNRLVGGRGRFVCILVIAIYVVIHSIWGDLSASPSISQSYSEQLQIDLKPTDSNSRVTAQIHSCPRIFRRDEWGARDRKEHLPLNNPTPYAVIFHTYGENCMSEDTCKDTLREIQDLHMNEYNWADIGYNFVIGGDGNVYEGRGCDVKGAHSRHYNAYAQGIALTGLYKDSAPSDLMLSTLRALLQCLKDRKKLHPCYTLYGHCQTRDTDSPGSAFFEVLQTWPEWREREDSIDNPEPDVHC